MKDTVDILHLTLPEINVLNNNDKACFIVHCFNNIELKLHKLYITLSRICTVTVNTKHYYQAHSKSSPSSYGPFKSG